MLKNIGDQCYISSSTMLKLNGINVLVFGSGSLCSKVVRKSHVEGAIHGFINNFTEMFIYNFSDYGRESYKSPILCFNASGTWHGVVLSEDKSSAVATINLLAPYYDKSTDRYIGQFMLTKIGSSVIPVPVEKVANSGGSSTSNPKVSVGKMELGVIYSNSSNSYVKIKDLVYNGKKYGIVINNNYACLRMYSEYGYRRDNSAVLNSVFHSLLHQRYVSVFPSSKYITYVEDDQSIDHVEAMRILENELRITEKSENFIDNNYS